MTIEFVLVSCSKSKQDGTHRARDLYEPSAIFRKRRTFSEQHGGLWGVLSAKHGYLRPWEPVECYDTHITDRTTAWAAFVLQDLLPDLEHLDVDQVTILAGSKYIDPLVTPLEARGYDVVDWNRGKMPGQRMSSLNDEIRAADGGSDGE